jgi:hypothetical protein
MGTLNIAPQDFEKMISSTFDSVNLINELNLLESLNEDNQRRYDVNMSHIEMMMEEEWFVEALTTEQKELINQILTKE